MFNNRNDVDELDRHPLRYFFSEDRMTESRMNVVLAFFPFAMIYSAFTVGYTIPWLIAAALCWLLLWRNWRRYRERVFFAIAERDRPAQPPTHPDAR